MHRWWPLHGQLIDLHHESSEARFRSELSEWIRTVERPAGLRDYGATPTADDIGLARAWQRILYDASWAGLSWPTQYGGRGSSTNDLAIFAEMMAEAELSRQLNIVGLELAASMIMAFGTESQKERHLTAILCGDEIWCQLFSEPNAGSDLASLSCRAIESNGQWLVSGQRVWTSGAHFSDYGLLLAKTKPGQPNHKAISCFLLPMNRAGIEIRPLVQMDGEAKFNEVFLNDVKADSSELLGELGQGWQVAMSTLDRERLSLGAQAVALLDWLERLRSDLPGRLNDPNIRQAWIGLWNRIRLLRMTWLRAVNTTGPDADSAIAVLKVVASELQRDVASHAVDYLGMFAQAGDDRGAHRQRFLAASRATIAGGTSEIQRNILGERILDLPRGPR